MCVVGGGGGVEGPSDLELGEGVGWCIGVVGFDSILCGLKPRLAQHFLSPCVQQTALYTASLNKGGLLRCHVEML